MSDENFKKIDVDVPEENTGVDPSLIGDFNKVREKEGELAVLLMEVVAELANKVEKQEQVIGALVEFTSEATNTFIKITAALVQIGQDVFDEE